MLKTFNKARIRCPIAFYEEINAVFLKKNYPKMTKIPKFFDLLRYYAILVKSSMDFVV